MKTIASTGVLCLSLLAGPASSQGVLFDFDNTPATTPLPLSLTAGGITAALSATGQGFAIQPANTLGFSPAGFAGNCVYPNGVLAADLVVDFSQPLQQFSIDYAPEEYGCDSSALMRATAYLGGTQIASSTTTAPHPGTWPTGVLSLSSAQSFDRVVVHYDTPPTCTDWGPVFMADNMTVAPAMTDRHLIAGVAHNPGAAGTVWRTDVAAVNPGSSDAAVTLTLRTSQDTLTATTTVPAGGEAEWRNVVETLLGAAADAHLQGALEVDSDQPLQLAARTYDDTPAGTYGQSLPALTTAEALRPGMTGTLPMLRSGADFRTNVGALNLGTGTATVAVRLFDAAGVNVGSDVSLNLPASEWRQVNDVFTAAGAGDQATAFAIVTLTAGDAVWVYASLVDNHTGDPTTIAVLAR